MALSYRGGAIASCIDALRGSVAVALFDVRADIRAGRLPRLLSHYVGEPVPINAIMQSARYLPARGGPC